MGIIRKIFPEVARSRIFESVTESTVLLQIVSQPAEFLRVSVLLEEWAFMMFLIPVSY